MKLFINDCQKNAMNEYFEHYLSDKNLFHIVTSLIFVFNLAQMSLMVKFLKKKHSDIAINDSNPQNTLYLYNIINIGFSSAIIFSKLFPSVRNLFYKNEYNYERKTMSKVMSFFYHVVFYSALISGFLMTFKNLIYLKNMKHERSNSELFNTLVLSYVSLILYLLVGIFYIASKYILPKQKSTIYKTLTQQNNQDSKLNM